MTITGERVGTASRPRRDERAVAVFATWMILGLFLDGWSHGANKPETFFSPWHAILYSGFVAAIAWFAWQGRRNGSMGTPDDRLMTVGLVLFVTGAVGDGVWHEIFGIEVDLEALLSPTHLLLFVGGFLLGTMPVRAALSDDGEVRPSWSAWWPQAIAITLGTALVGFFTMYLSAFEPVGGERVLGDDRLRELLESYGVARVLFTNLLLVVPLLLVLRRWQPPTGTFLMLFSGVAVLMSGLDGFEWIELVVPAVLAGVVAEVLAARRAWPLAAVAGGASLAWWASFFVVAHASYGITWTVELWAGTIVLTTASSVLLASLRPTRVRAVDELLG